MTTTNDETTTPAHRHAIIGNENKTFWLYDSTTGFDLTHPPTPTSPPIHPRLTLQTTTVPITLDPAKSALVIIDMQNYFLSAALGRQRGAGHAALHQLAHHAIPACRRARIQVIWLNWGLNQQDLETLPPAVSRAFGFAAAGGGGEVVAVDKFGGDAGKKKSCGPGSDMGRAIHPESGEVIEVGRLLMRGQWNTALCPPLDRLFEEGRGLGTRPDVWVHKNRMSGMWGGSGACEEVLRERGIETLMFAGVNTDQCVGGTYMDCFSKGYDCILLNDGCGTTSPDFAQQTFEFNAGNTWGFNTSCQALAEGVESMVE